MVHSYLLFNAFGLELLPRILLLVLQKLLHLSMLPGLESMDFSFLLCFLRHFAWTQNSTDYYVAAETHRFLPMIYKGNP